MGLKDQFGQIRKALSLRKQVKAIQKELEEYVVTAEHLGGKIKVSVNGNLKVEKIEIASDVLKPENKAKIEKGLKEALKEATNSAQKLAANKMKEVAGDLGIGF